MIHNKEFSDHQAVSLSEARMKRNKRERDDGNKQHLLVMISWVYIATMYICKYITFDINWYDRIPQFQSNPLEMQRDERGRVMKVTGPSGLMLEYLAQSLDFTYIIPVLN